MRPFPPGRRSIAAVLAGAVLTLTPTTLPAEPPQKVTTVEGITEYRLANGLRVLLFPDPSGSTVTVNLTVLVGSRHEGYGETGMAHLLEHMVFKGTPAHPDVPKALRDHGANFNGTTNADRTNYFETLPATDENLEFALRLEADRLVHSFVRRDDLVSEMTVVRNEFERGENDPRRVLGQRVAAAAYEWHNYGKSTIGNRSDIERVPIENLQAFYKKFYQPGNAVLVVAGQFDEPTALALAQKHFGPLPRPKRTLDATYTEEPPQDGERTVVLRRVGKVGLVGVAYHIPAAAHPDFVAVQVLADVLAAAPTGRLYQALVPTKKATSVGGFATPGHDPGLLRVTAETEGNRLDACRDALIQTLEQLGERPVTPEEVERSKVKLQRFQEQLMARSSLVALRLSEYAALGDWRLMFLERDRLAAVTAADVNRAAKTYLQRNNRTVGLYVPSETPQRAEIPATPTVAELVKDYRSQQSTAPGEAFDPTPATIEARTTRTELPAGVKAALLPRKTRGETVTAQITLHFGNEQSLAGRRTASELLGPMLLRGTKRKTRPQLQDELNRLGARLSVGSEAGRLTATLTTKRGHVVPALALLGEVLREPSFPADEFEVLKRGERQALEAARVEPAGLARQLLQRRLSPYAPGDARYQPTYEEQLAELDATTVDQVRTLYETQVAGRHGELAVVGDFDPEPALAAVNGFLGGWTAGPYRRLQRRIKPDVTGGHESVRTPDKANAVYLAGLDLAVGDGDADYPALVLGNFIFGGGALSSRLGNRVRQKEGLSYGVNSTFSASSHDPVARFRMTASCKPENVGRVEQAVAEELEKFLRDGVSAAELAEAKRAYLDALKVRRAGDEALAGLLADALEDGRTMAYHAELERQIHALTPDDLRAAFRKHIDPAKVVLIRAGDFKK